MASSRTSPDQSLGQLVSGVTSNVSSLVRLELELARTEIQSQLKQGAAGGGMVVAAAFLALLATLLLSFAAVYGLSYVMPLYAAFLTVAGVYLVVAGLLGYIASRRFKELKGPERTIAQVEKTKEIFLEHAEARAQAKASGMTVDELTARREAEQANTAVNS